MKSTGNLNFFLKFSASTLMHFSIEHNRALGNMSDYTEIM